MKTGAEADPGPRHPQVTTGRHLRGPGGTGAGPGLRRLILIGHGVSSHGQRPEKTAAIIGTPSTTTPSQTTATPTTRRTGSCRPRGGNSRQVGGTPERECLLRLRALEIQVTLIHIQGNK